MVSGSQGQSAKMAPVCKITFASIFLFSIATLIQSHQIQHLNQLSNVTLTLNRSSLSRLYEGRTVVTEFILNGTIPAEYEFTILINDEKFAVVTRNSTIQLPEVSSSFEGSFGVRGERLGLGLLSFYLHPSDQDPVNGENSTLLRNGFEVVVLRTPSLEEFAFEMGIIVLAVLLYIGFGCVIDLSIVWKVLKRPIAPAIGFFSQFVVMPLIGFGLAKALGLDNAFAFGLVTMACSPGGGSSNVWVNLYGGDLDLSLTMTSISTISALFMMPAWLYLLGTQFIDSSRVDIPYGDIAITLLYIIIPCAIGVGIKKCSSKVAGYIAKGIRPFSAIFVLYIVGFGTYVNWYMFEVIGDELLIIPAAFLLPCLGYLSGFFLAIILRRDKKVAVTIAIETGVQNASIPILVLQRSFPQPEGDLGATMPTAAAYFYTIPIIIVWAILFTYRRFTGIDPLSAEEKEADPEDLDKNKIDISVSATTASGDTDVKYVKTNPAFVTEL